MLIRLLLLQFSTVLLFMINPPDVLLNSKFVPVAPIPLDTREVGILDFLLDALKKWTLLSLYQMMDRMGSPCFRITIRIMM